MSISCIFYSIVFNNVGGCLLIFFSLTKQHIRIYEYKYLRNDYNMNMKYVSFAFTCFQHFNNCIHKSFLYEGANVLQAESNMHID